MSLTPRLLNFVLDILAKHTNETNKNRYQVWGKKLFAGNILYIKKIQRIHWKPVRNNDFIVAGQKINVQKFVLLYTNSEQMENEIMDNNSIYIIFKKNIFVISNPLLLH